MIKIKGIVIIFVMIIFNLSIKMKEQKKNKEKVVEKMFGMELTTNEALNKYRGPEFEPPKLKGINEKFKNGYIIHR
jgi:hypothetical protein